MYEIYLQSFVLYFVVIDPFGTTPIFMSLTKNQNAKEKIKSALEGVLTASLCIMENASPDVLEDIKNFFLKLVPEDSSLYEHGYEGDDDMPAHIKYMLTQTSLTIPVSKGKMILGTWQGIYLFEHRYQGGERKITLSF
ncbi:secondary thiamine-phosphate synthase enzyme YjbQ, partial [Pelagibacteraceae bacterium]|nr:secondary thiamine-phosphate synthase enzyme YjbQ [Pelagibacteraceae bacterium]